MVFEPKIVIELPGSKIIQSLVREIGIVISDPAVQSRFQGKRVGPIIGPDQVFLDGAHDSFRIGIALGIIPGGKDLLDAQGTAVAHKALTGRLAAIIRDQEQRFFRQRLLNPQRESGIDRLMKGREPVPGFGLEAQGVADDLFGIPVQDHGQVEPAPARELDLGHVNTPELVRPISVRFGASWAAFGFQPGLRSNQQAVFPEQAVNPLLVDLDALAELEIRPNPAIAPERVIGLQLFDFR